jgi:hypothetical protein
MKNKDKSVPQIPQARFLTRIQFGFGKGLSGNEPALAAESGVQMKSFQMGAMAFVNKTRGMCLST